MGISKTPGLTKRGEVWHLDKQIGGTRLCGSTGTGDLAKAQAFLAKRITEVHEARIYGLRTDRTFRVAATKYLKEFAHKKSIEDDARHLKKLDPFIGELLLKQVHMGSLQEFIDTRREEGVKNKTINLALGVVRQILNLAATSWLDDQGISWLEKAPKITLLSIKDARPPYPLTWDEQSTLFPQLPDHLARMALFKVNTGCREHEVVGLQWSWEVEVPELNTSVFLIPGDEVKNTEERLVVLNRVARSVIDSVRGMHPERVFIRATKKGKPKPVTKMYNTAWKSARARAADKWEKERKEPAPAGFRNIRVHDLKHTFGRRLRAAGVSFEDRQDLLGHKSGRITTHYSQAELANLIASAEKACGDESRKSPATSWLRRKAG